MQLAISKTQLSTSFLWIRTSAAVEQSCGFAPAKVPHSCPKSPTGPTNCLSVIMLGWPDAHPAACSRRPRPVVGWLWWVGSTVRLWVWTCGWARGAGEGDGNAIIDSGHARAREGSRSPCSRLLVSCVISRQRLQRLSTSSDVPAKSRFLPVDLSPAFCIE